MQVHRPRRRGRRPGDRHRPNPRAGRPGGHRDAERGAAPLRTAAPDAATGLLPLPPALHLFHHVFADSVGQTALDLARAASTGDAAASSVLYGRLFAQLAARGWAGDAWRAHVATAVAADGNAFTLAPVVAAGLRAGAEADLAALSATAADATFAPLRARLRAAGYVLLPYRDLGACVPQGVAAALAATDDWPALAADLRLAAQAGGAGAYALHPAYRWRPDAHGAGGGTLVPIPRPDPVRFENLYGYAEQRRLVLQNTEHFLRGLPANDVLLYGDRGTGKSSTVKALLQRLGPRGLRLVEVGRRHLPDLPRVLEALDGQPQRFILYVDDLSFEEDETEYKDGKAALQGGLGARPSNVLVYATSNRRHLVRERLSDRPEPADDDPRAGDAVQEKLSLADRFGLTVIFGAPDQDLYLGIVTHLAAERGLGLPQGELRARALRWALWYNGRSGRTARQFVDALEGEVRSADAEARATPAKPVP